MLWNVFCRGLVTAGGLLRRRSTGHKLLYWSVSVGIRRSVGRWLLVQCGGGATQAPGKRAQKEKVSSGDNGKVGVMHQQ